MKFNIDINIDGIPTTQYRFNAEKDFKSLPKSKGDLLLTKEPGKDEDAEFICFRDGREYKLQRQADEIYTIEFDDFVPGMTLDHNPEWYDLLKDRIVATNAQEDYGQGQGITVTEHIAHGYAIARIRNIQASWGRNGELVYVVKITATGTESFRDARMLHSIILGSDVTSNNQSASTP